ncbi:MAG TPA: zf-HC2 domain-containing protein [Candidatus Sulfopaludibacter sp.]|jgi:anti-sigma factor RsiW|nr:zf-HC2 domain-containing protein [Candidatus Sulfopaludibacter sp.]
MNCIHWEERIALWAGGDLKAADAAEVERHLEDCPACQVFAAGLKESLEFAREAHQEAIAPAHFAAVRARVLAELAGTRRPWWRSAWTYGLSAAAVCALLLAIGLPPRQVAVTTRPAVLPHVQVPIPDRPIVRQVQAVHRRTHRRAAPVPIPAGEEKPVIVKLVTDDPNVVIYWISDSSGE